MPTYICEITEGCHGYGTVRKTRRGFGNMQAAVNYAVKALPDCPPPGRGYTRPEMTGYQLTCAGHPATHVSIWPRRPDLEEPFIAYIRVE